MSTQSTSIIKTDPRQAALKKLLTGDGVRAAMAAVLPKLAAQVGTTPERIIGAALVNTAKMPALLGCTPDSILRALLECAQLGLTPGGVLGEAYLIPYGGECTLQIGVKGYQRLAFDAGRIKRIVGRAVRQKDVFEVEYEPNETIIHKPAVREAGPLIAAYAKFVYSDTTPQYEVLSSDDIAAIRRQADSRKPSPAWRDWPDQMAIKSAIKRGAKRIDLSPTSPLARAVELDHTGEDGTQGELLRDLDLPALDQGAVRELAEAQAQIPQEEAPAQEPTGHAALGVKRGAAS